MADTDRREVGTDVIDLRIEITRITPNLANVKIRSLHGGDVHLNPAYRTIIFALSSLARDTERDAEDFIRCVAADLRALLGIGEA